MEPLHLPNSCWFFSEHLALVLDFGSHTRSRMAGHHGRDGRYASRAYADDRLPLASLGPVEGGDGIVEGRDVADVRPQSSVPYPLDELTQLGAIGYDDEVESRLTAGSAPGADDVRAGLTCELGRHRTDYAGRAVHEDALPRTKAAVL